MLPKISCILISFNRADDLRLAIEAIRASDYPQDRIEIVVVDNDSRDGSADVAASFEGVVVIRNGENKGFAEANDQALPHTSGDYVALINNDAVIAPDWIRLLVDRLEAAPDVAAAGGKMHLWDDESPLGDRSNDYYAHALVDADTGDTRTLVGTRVGTSDEARDVATLSGAAVMIRRTAIRDVADDVGAPFLEPLFFTYFEETDFFARAIRRGWRLVYAGDAACWHRVRASTAREPYRYLYFMFRNRLLFAFRNFDERELRAVVLDTEAKAARALIDLPWKLVREIREPDDHARAQRDAWRWLATHRSTLRKQRAALRGGRSYNEAVRAIQSRAAYYGHPRPEVVELVPRDARFVVDVGCAAGALGRGLKEARPAIEVRGVEPVADVAARAREVLDDVHVAGAEDAPPTRWPAPDCVIFADVLEHLADPWSALASWRARLAPGGTVVISLPNVLHASVVEGLVGGRFDYVDAGVLDRTHLRFFTRATAIEMVERAGFVVRSVRRVWTPPRIEPFVGPVSRWIDAQKGRESRDGMHGVRSRIADLLTVQFLIVAQ